MDRWRAARALLALAACIASSAAAPTASNQTALDSYDGAPEGCYYNFQHYGEGDRIMTNEPCLNCTCHNRMLMCYLRVCPFTKAIGQDCTVEKRADQCCPIVTCPDVPVDLLTSTSTTSPAEYGATGLGKLDKYGCSINGKYFPEGSKVPPTPNKPCEHCYCIRNMTTCVMQECTLHVDGCTPIYHKDVCCPVRYSCDHPEDEIPLLDDMTTTVRPTPGFLLTTTTVSPVTQMTQDCVHDDQVFPDGALIKTEKACEHCYCMKGDIVCVVQECGTPMENEGKNCTSLAPREGQCCPDTYICEGDSEISTGSPFEITTTKDLGELTTISPPRRVAEGSGYRNEPDDSPHIEITSPESDIEGSGEEQTLNDIISLEKQTTGKPEESLLTTEIELISTTKTSLMDEVENGTPVIDFGKEHDISTEGILIEDTTEFYPHSPSTTVVPNLQEVERSTAEPVEIHGTISEQESSDLDQLIPVATTASTLKEPEKDTTESFEELSITTTIPDTKGNDQLGSTKAPPTELDEGQHFGSNDISETETSEPEDFTSITTSKSVVDEISIPTMETEQNIDSDKNTEVLSTSIPILEDSDIYTTETSQDQDNISSFEKESIEPEQLIPFTNSPNVDESTQSNIIPSHVSDQDTSDLDEFIPISTNAPALEDVSKVSSEASKEAITSTSSSIPSIEETEETTQGSIEKEDLTPMTVTEKVASDIEQHFPRTTMAPEVGVDELITSLPEEEQNVIPDIQTTSNPVSEYESNTENQPGVGSTITDTSSELFIADVTTPVLPKETASSSFYDRENIDITKVENPTVEFDLSTSSLPKDEEITVTTEPTFRKEDSSEPAQKQPELVPITSATFDAEKQTQSSMTDVMEAALTTRQHAEPTETTLSSESTQSFKDPDTAFTTPSADKLEFIETTTINIGENEIDEESAIPPGRIPGEGDCLIDGITYRNESVVPSTNKCHTSCKCLSSIIKCDTIICSPQPEYMNNCQSIYDSPESCCPTYICDHSKETVPPESQSQMSGTEKPVTSIECHGDQCEIVKEDSLTTNEGQAHAVKPCDGDSCDIAPSKPVISDIPEVPEKQCKGDTCHSSIDNLPVSVTPEIPDKSCKGEDCDVQADKNLIPQLPEDSIELCQGDDCTTASDTPITKIPDLSVETCEGDGCDVNTDKTHIPELPEDSIKSCEGDNCDKGSNKTPALEVPQESGKPCQGDSCNIDTDKAPIPELQEKPCEGDNCDKTFDEAQKPEDSKKPDEACKGEGCVEISEKVPIADIPVDSALPCEGADCNINLDKTPTKPTKPCEGDSCDVPSDKAPILEVPIEPSKPCEGDGCDTTSDKATTTEDVIEPVTPCEGDGCLDTSDKTHIPAGLEETMKPCEGDSCQVTSDKVINPELVEDSVTPCDGDSCDTTSHKTHIPEVAEPPVKSCDGEDCGSSLDHHNIPELLEEHVKPCEGDGCQVKLDQATTPEHVEKPITTCEGENCVTTSDKTHTPAVAEPPVKSCIGDDCGDSLDENHIPVVLEEPVKPCEGDNCHIKSDAATTPEHVEESMIPCEGDACDTTSNKAPIPEVIQETEKPCAGDICETSSDKAPSIPDILQKPVKPCEGDSCDATSDKAPVTGILQEHVKPCEGDSCEPSSDKATIPEIKQETKIPCEGDACDATSDRAPISEVKPESLKPCKGDACDTTSDKAPIPEILQEPLKPCEGEVCDATPEKAPIPSILQEPEKTCEGDACDATSEKAPIPTILQEPEKPCDGDACDTTSEKAPITTILQEPEKPCEGDACDATSEKAPIPTILQEPVKPCEGDACDATSEKAPIPTILQEPVKPCEGGACDTTSDKAPIPEILQEPVIPCVGNACDTTSDETPISEVIQETVKPCEGDACDATSDKAPIPEIPKETVKPCEGNNCDTTSDKVPEQVIPERPDEPCEGEGCNIIDNSSEIPQVTIGDDEICTKENGCAKPQVLEPSCVGDSCRRQESPNVGNKPFECTGIECVQEVSTELPQYTQDISRSTSEAPEIYETADTAQELPSSEEPTVVPISDEDKGLTSIPGIIESSKTTQVPEAITTIAGSFEHTTQIAQSETPLEINIPQVPIKQNTESLTGEEGNQITPTESQDIKPQGTEKTILPDDNIGTQAPQTDNNRLQDASTDIIHEQNLQTEQPIGYETEDYTGLQKITKIPEVATESISKVTDFAENEIPKQTETPISDETYETQTKLQQPEEKPTESPDQTFEQVTTLPDISNNDQPDPLKTESPGSPVTESEIILGSTLPEHDGIQELTTEKESMITSHEELEGPEIKVTDMSVTESNKHFTESIEPDLTQSEVTTPAVESEDVVTVQSATEPQEKSTKIPELSDMEIVMHETESSTTSQLQTETPEPESKLADKNKPVMHEDEKPIVPPKETPELEPETFTVPPVSEVAVTGSQEHADTIEPEIIEILHTITTPNPTTDMEKPEADNSKRTTPPEFFSTESELTPVPVMDTGSEIKMDHTVQPSLIEKEDQATATPTHSVTAFSKDKEASAGQDQETLTSTISQEEQDLKHKITEKPHVSTDTMQSTDISELGSHEITTKETFIPSLDNSSSDKPQEYSTDSSAPESERTTEQNTPVEHDEINVPPVIQAEYESKEPTTESYELPSKSSILDETKTDVPEYETTDRQKVVTETPEHEVTGLMELTTKISESSIGLSETETVPSMINHEANYFTESPVVTDGRRTETPLSLVTKPQEAIEEIEHESDTKQSDTSVTDATTTQAFITKSPEILEISTPVTSEIVETSTKYVELITTQREKATTEATRYESETKSPQIFDDISKLVPVTESQDVPIASDRPSSSSMENDLSGITTESIQITIPEDDKSVTADAIPAEIGESDQQLTEKPVENDTETPEQQHKQTVPDLLEATESITEEPVSVINIEHDNTKYPVQLTTEKSETEFSTKLDNEIIKPETSSSIPELMEVPAEPIQKVTTLIPELGTTSEPKYEIPESTPYLIELEEHPHIIDETSSTITSYEDDTNKPAEYDPTVTELSLTTITPEETSVKQDEMRLTVNTESNTEVYQPTSAGPAEVNDKATQPTVAIDDLSTVSDHSSEAQVDTRFDSEETSPPLIEKDQTTIRLPTSTESSSTQNSEFNQNKETPVKPDLPLEITSPEKENISTTTKATTALEDIASPTKATSTLEDIASPTEAPIDKYTKLEDKLVDSVPSTSAPEISKPGLTEKQPTEDIAPPEDGGHFAPSGTTGYGQESEYIDEDPTFGPSGTCRYGGKVYVSAQQIPRDDPCDFCFCFRSDIICLQQSCPPPIHGCHEEPIQGFCCPRYECPVSMATTLNVTTTTTTTTTTLPPNFPTHSYKGAAQRRGCQIKGHTYKVGEVVRASSGPCLHCTCGGDGQMKCDPKVCTPEPMLRQMIAAAVSAKRRR